MSTPLVRSLREVPLDELRGLRPRVWLCVGAGYVREDVKALVLEQGIGFVGEAITTPIEIAQRVVGDPKGERVLSSQARQEVLRSLLAEPKINQHLSELKRLRRQTGFFRKLDQAIQAGRICFAHELEEQLYEERLEQRLGVNPVRHELRLLTSAYEAWMKQFDLRDPPVLFRDACEILEAEWPQRLSRPETIYFFNAQNLESLENRFIEALHQWMEVKRVRPTAAENSAEVPVIHWERWHTLDDAAESLADHLVSAPLVSAFFSGTPILMSDYPAVRRTMNRALAMRRIPLADSRDPTRIRWDETIKWALCPLDLVAHDFERLKTIAWMREYLPAESSPLTWVNEINARGVRRGLDAYAGGALAAVHLELKS